MHEMPRTGQVRARPARSGGTVCPPSSRAARGLLVAMVVAAALAGCSSGGRVKSADSSQFTSPSPTAASASSSPSVRDQVLSQYRAFWEHLTPASVASRTERRAILSRYAVDPELSSLLGGMARGDRQGTVFYGRDVPRPSITNVSVAQRLAIIRDCQDSSKAGNAVRRTGRKLTVGVARHLVVATMHLIDGLWRVAFVTYEQQQC